MIAARIHHEQGALRIAGGCVVDPMHGPPVVRDVLVRGRRIVSELEPRELARAAVIDARGRLVLPGAIDMHCHVASRGVMMARQFGHAARKLIPSARRTAHDYLKQGYTTVIDAAVGPEEAAFTRQRFAMMRGLHGGFLLELGMHRPLLSTLDKQGESAATELLRELIACSGAMGMKLVNPGHVDAVDEVIPGMQKLTARRLLHFAADAVGAMGLSHPLHLHAPGLGQPGNVHETIALLEAMQGRAVHLAHAQFYAYDRTHRGQFAGGAKLLAEYLSEQAQVTCDSGCISFGPAMMITRDGPLSERLAGVAEGQTVRQGGWCIAPMRYRADHPVHAMQWAVGLELLLRMVDTGRIALTVDHPNGGSFTAMPGLLRLLADPALRERELANVHPAARERTSLASLRDVALDVSQQVMLTSTAPAKALGLRDRGHLGAGALADVVVGEGVRS